MNNVAMQHSNRQAPSALIIGGTSWDTVIRVAELPASRPQTLFAQSAWESVGSTGAGKALNLRRLGWATTLHAQLGDDEAGRLALQALQSAGVRVLVMPDPRGTERHTNLIADDGGRLSIYTHYGTFDAAVDVQAVLAELPLHDVVLLNIANYARPLIAPIKQAGRALWIDVHDWDGDADYHRDFVDAADVLFLSSDRLPNWRDVMAGLFAAGGKRLVVCTHGAQGATAIDQQAQFVEVAARPVTELVDSNGAGDAFMAATLHGLHSGRDLKESLAFAALAGALCVQCRGLASDALESPWPASL
jgi:acarbose 7IV-phosphotransferase